jgi:chondroitin sulfate proteoglycan 4
VPLEVYTSILNCERKLSNVSPLWLQIENVDSVLEWVRGVARCPYSPEANVTALLTRSGHYFIGSPMDFSGADPAISRSLAGGSGSTVRTKQFDSKWLNEPQFVGSFETASFVYFLFRESAVEYINCGKVHDTLLLRPASPSSLHEMITAVCVV